MRKDDFMESKKGIATWVIQVFTAFFAISMVMFLYFLLYGRYFDIHSIVIGHEAQRHSMNIAQVILSSDNLVYEEDVSGSVRYHRGVLDKEKLDFQMNRREIDKFESDLSNEIGYPSTAMQIVVVDMETDDKWVLAVGRVGLDNQQQFLECLYNNLDLSLFGLATNYQYKLWNYWDWTECQETYETKTGTYESEFPVMIMDFDELHTGRLFVRISEL